VSAYILSGARTPVGSFMGTLSSQSAPKLGAVAIKAALERSEIADFSLVQEVFMGLVVAAGVGQAPARQAALGAGLPDSVPCTTINKVCGSGMKAVITGVQTILAGDNDLVVAGGMENMSLSPHLVSMRAGHKFGPSEMKDSMQIDGLWDVYSDRAMGNCAEECAQKYNYSREMQDQLAIESFKRSQRAIKDGVFKAEIAPVIIKDKRGETIVDTDEGPFKANFEKIPSLRPAFSKDGTITAANASTINDGAAALVIAGEKYKQQAQYKVVAYASHAAHPTWFTTAPVEAMKKTLKKSGLAWTDIGVFEINEAFAVVAMNACKELELDSEKVNIYGGGISLGHPIGASGARIIVTLMTAMQRKKEKYGMAGICIGGGEALAIILESL